MPSTDPVSSITNCYRLTYMQKAGDTCDISQQIFLDFPQNFRLRTRNQYCAQAIAWGSTILDGGSTILDGGSTILDGSSTIFCRFSPFFIDFHDLRTFVAIYILSWFTQFFRNFFLAKIASSATSHVFCMYECWVRKRYENIWFVLFNKDCWYIW